MEFSLFFILLCGRAGYHGRMQQIMQMEKDRHAEFLRQFNIEQGDSKGIIVQIVSRSLEGKLTVCCCLFQEKSNSTIRSDASTDHAMNESRTKRTIIFSPKICDNVDLLVGNIIRIFPPWSSRPSRRPFPSVKLCPSTRTTRPGRS